MEEAWQKIQATDYMVWIHPVWWDRLLSGRTARIITTIDQPARYYRWIYSSSSAKSLKRSILKFCGIKLVKVSYIGSIRHSDEAQRKKWIKKFTGWDRN